MQDLPRRKLVRVAAYFVLVPTDSLLRIAGDDLHPVNPFDVQLNRRATLQPDALKVHVAADKVRAVSGFEELFKCLLFVWSAY